MRENNIHVHMVLCDIVSTNAKVFPHMFLSVLSDVGIAVEDVDTLESELKALQHSVQKYV